MNHMNTLLLQALLPCNLAIWNRVSAFTSLDDLQNFPVRQLWLCESFLCQASSSASKRVRDQHSEAHLSCGVMQDHPSRLPEVQHPVSCFSHRSAILGHFPGTALMHDYPTHLTALHLLRKQPSWTLCHPMTALWGWLGHLSKSFQMRC